MIRIDWTSVRVAPDDPRRERAARVAKPTVDRCGFRAMVAVAVSNQIRHGERIATGSPRFAVVDVARALAATWHGARRVRGEIRAACVAPLSGRIEWIVWHVSGQATRGPAGSPRQFCDGPCRDSVDSVDSQDSLFFRVL